ncbi:MAG: hypothetical protein HC799_00635 [Limnothrix sp. RL_2_0]|nr:hypothetical protein [Limnothrix sp. RL_2_0]
MAQQLYLLLKIIALSAVGSALIKYGVRFGLHREAIAPAPGAALVAILLPSLVFVGLLWWRSQDSKSVK